MESFDSYLPNLWEDNPKMLLLPWFYWFRILAWLLSKYEKKNTKQNKGLSIASAPWKSSGTAKHISRIWPIMQAIRQSSGNRKAYVCGVQPSAPSWAPPTITAASRPNTKVLLLVMVDQSGPPIKIGRRAAGRHWSLRVHLLANNLVFNKRWTSYQVLGPKLEFELAKEESRNHVVQSNRPHTHDHSYWVPGRNKTHLSQSLQTDHQ